MHGCILQGSDGNIFLPANVQYESSTTILHIAPQLNSHLQVLHVNITYSFYPYVGLAVWLCCFLPPCWSLSGCETYRWIGRWRCDSTHLQLSLVITTRVPCVVRLWSCEPAAHQKHHVPLGALIRQARLDAAGWGQAISSLGLSGWPCLGWGAPHWPAGYRGTEISGFVTLYLSQASAVGLDGPGLAQRRGELFYISHKAKKGFGIPVTVRWEMGSRWKFLWDGARMGLS